MGLALAAWSAGLSGCASGVTDADIEPVKIAQFRALVDESKEKPGTILIVDARSADEYRAAHIEGARNIKPEQLRPESPIFTQLNEYDTIIVYGADPGSGAAKSASKRLMDFSDTKVLWFQGGMKFWKAAGFPVVEDAGPKEPKPVNISPTVSSPPLTQPQPTAIPSGLPR
jgi:rhodanese-related sulfurtransferase